MVGYFDIFNKVLKPQWSNIIYVRQMRRNWSSDKTECTRRLNKSKKEETKEQWQKRINQCDRAIQKIDLIIDKLNNE